MFRLPRVIRNLPMPVKVVGGAGLGYIAYHGLMGTSYTLPVVGLVSPTRTVGIITGLGAAALLGSAAADTGMLGSEMRGMMGCDATRNPDGDETVESLLGGEEIEIPLAAMPGDSGYALEAPPAYAPRRTERDIGRYLDGLAHRFDDGGDPVMWNMINRARCSVNAGKPAAVAQLHAVEAGLADRDQGAAMADVASARVDLAQRWGMDR